MPVKHKDLLDKETAHQVEQIGSVDILVGIPSFNNARTISHVVQAVSAGLMKHFPESRSVIVNSDGGSTDGTRDVVASTEYTSMERLMVRHRLHPVHKVITPNHQPQIGRAHV